MKDTEYTLAQISSETSDQTVLWIPSDPWFRRRVDHTQDKQAIEVSVYQAFHINSDPHSSQIDPKTTDQTVLWIPSDPWFRRRVGQTQDEQVLEVSIYQTSLRFLISNP